jgi:hypothetical protein
MPQARCSCRLRPQNNQRVCLPLMFPPTSTAEAPPLLHFRQQHSTDLGPKREGREREPDLEVLFPASASIRIASGLLFHARAADV